MEKREYIEQYSNFYLQRLNGLRRKVYDVAHKSWCDMIIEGSTVYHSERVLDLGNKKINWTIGTIFKEMKLKPSIFDEISSSVSFTLCNNEKIHNIHNLTSFMK